MTALITTTEKQSLWQAAAQGDRNAHDQLLLAHDAMIRKEAYKFARYCKHLTADDLYQEGMIGAIRAMQHYDSTIASFTTYVLPWIQKAIRRAIDNQEDTIRLPVYLRSKQQAPMCISLDVNHSQEDDDTPLADTIPTPTPDQGTGIDWTVLFDRADLTPRERYVISARYSGNGETLERTGERIGLTRERIRFIETEAIRKLRAVAPTLAAAKIMTDTPTVSGVPDPRPTLVASAREYTQEQKRRNAPKPTSRKKKHQIA